MVDRVVLVLGWLGLAGLGREGKGITLKFDMWGGRVLGMVWFGYF